MFEELRGPRVSVRPYNSADAAHRFKAIEEISPCWNACGYPASENFDANGSWIDSSSVSSLLFAKKNFKED
jgi:hypothetical protein